MKEFLKHSLLIICLFCFQAICAQEKEVREFFNRYEFVDSDESDDEIGAELSHLKSTQSVSYVNNLVFSHESGFYYENFDLQIENSVRAADLIFYTLDGSIPTPDSYRYEEKIPIELPGNSTQSFESYVVRARSFMDSLPSSQIVSKTYLTFPDSIDRFSYPVISVITDPANFYDHETGIYIRGANYVPGNNWTGNYFMTGIEWERPVRLQYFTTRGELVMDQDAGVRIHGGLQRTAPQKSLRFYARTEYGQSTFNYQLLPQKSKNEYKRFLLRSSFGCWQSTIIKDPLAASLCRGLDFELMDYRPVIVYLNGQYWGIQTIRDYFGQFYISEKYHVDKESVSIGNDLYSFEGTKEKYDEALQIIDSAGFSDSELMQEIEGKMDMQSFINYNNAEIFLSNYDWPSGNKRWWSSPEYTEGKLGWLFYDLDAAFGSRGGPSYDMLRHSTIPGTGWPNGPAATKMLSTLLENDLFRDRFITGAAYVMNYYLHADTIITRTREIMEEYGLEMEGHLKRWSQGTVGTWEGRIESSLIGFARDRRKYNTQHYCTKFGLSGTSRLTLEVDTLRMGRIYINDMPVPFENNSGEYFNDVRIKLKAIPAPGFCFSHWEGDINYAIDTLSVVLSSDLSLSAVFIPGQESERFIRINELMAKNRSSVCDNLNEHEDWIEIYNGSDVAFDLDGLYLTDDLNLPFKWQISASYADSVSIPPYGFKLFFADNQTSQGVSHCNFKLNSSGETISLIRNVSGIPVILDSISYPDLPEDISWGRTTDGSKSWISFQTPTPGATNITIPLNIPKPEPRQFSIFPNPSSDHVKVFLESEENLFHQLSIFSMSGTIVKTVEFYGSGKTIDISDLNPGIYILGIRGDPMLKLKLIVPY